jgi:hypothetical protein
MARWLTFDRKTASTLRKQLPREQVFEHGSRNAVEYASVSNQNLVTLLPTGSSGEVAIAVFRQPAAGKASSAAPAPKPVLVEKPASAAQPIATPQSVPIKSITCNSRAKGGRTVGPQAERAFAKARGEPALRQTKTSHAQSWRDTRHA